MRRASPSLLSNLTKSYFFSRILPKHLFSDAYPSNPSPISPPLLNPCSKSHTLPLHSPQIHHPFPNCPSRTIQTLPSNAPPLGEKSDVEEAFESATSTEEILTTFEALESSLDENDKRLGVACLKVAQHLDSSGSEDHEKTLSFSVRALKILSRDGEVSVSVAVSLHLIGSASYNLKRFDESLEVLNRANQILGRLGKEGFNDSSIRNLNHAVEFLLANTKTVLGRREEALLNLRRCLELKESILEPNSRELGGSYRELGEAYAVVLNFEEALPLCLKALEIHKAQLGQSSLEVAHDRRLLGTIYVGLGEHEKALEQNELSQSVLKNLGLGSDLFHAEIDAANILVALGRFSEAMNTLKRVLQQADKESETRAFVFVSMAKALCNQEKFADSKHCLEISRGILDKKESVSPAKVAEAYAEISILYETMNEFETAVSLLKRTLSILEKLPQEQHMEGSVSGRIGWLLLMTGRVPEAVPYLENAAEKLKGSYGLKHFGMGYIYKNLGSAYLEMNQPLSAVKMFALAKDIMDVSMGPHHEDSIETCQNLANAYGAMGSYVLAMEFQQKVIDAWESLGPSAIDEFREAHRLLEQLKKKASGLPSSAVPQKALPLPQQ